MAEPHFVTSYKRLVAKLVSAYPLDEAMSRAVGGGYERFGAIEAAIVKYAGLRDGMALLDLGCGSGRLASVIGQQMVIEYVGIDIVQALLNYAKKKSPASYRFILNQTFQIPLPAASQDMVAAFSLFTHLLHTETYLYLRESHRVLRPGGAVVMSFLEFAEPRHWQVFADSAEAHRQEKLGHLNQFIERNTIDLWAEKIGFRREAFIGGSEAPWDDAPLGQALAILRRL